MKEKVAKEIHRGARRNALSKKIFTTPKVGGRSICQKDAKKQQDTAASSVGE